VIAAPIDVETRYLAAIARRNTSWARWQDALTLLALARDEIGFHDLRPYIRDVNDAQDAYEWAARDLVRERVIWRGAHDGSRPIAH
jgi:hypothetical protein